MVKVMSQLERVKNIKSMNEKIKIILILGRNIISPLMVLKRGEILFHKM